MSDELKQINSYLAIEHARFGERIQFEVETTPEVEEWPLPPLVIQPLVENAVKHGISCKEEGGKVWVQAAKKEGLLWIRVRDNGVGISTEAIAHTYAKKVSDRQNASMGLRNVNQRLQHIYGPASYRQHPEDGDHYHPASSFCQGSS